MQFKAVTLSLIATLAVADSISDIAAQVPSCAKTCIDTGAKDAGCATDDYKCQCKSIETITQNSALCIATTCTSDELNQTAQLTGELCLAVGKQAGDDSINSAIASLTGAAGSLFTSATGAAGDAFTSATAVVGSALTSATGAAGSALTSATGAAGSAFTSATGAAGGAISSAVNSDSNTPSPSPSPTATATPAAAAHHALAGMGMVGAAAVFAIAL